MTKTITIVVPVLNEQDTIGRFLERSDAVARSLAPAYSFQYLFVNDGSTDATWPLLARLSVERKDILAVDLSRSFGKEAALTAGIDLATGDAVVVSDVDLQDPPEVIAAMVAQWEAGFDVVIGERTNRAADSFAKRSSARWFYAVHNMLAEPGIPTNVGDFRLMDRKVVDAIKLLPERRRFMRGLLSWVGFRTTTVGYVREARSAGYSKYSGWRMWNYALEAITSFSTVPLELMGYIGLVVSLGAFGYGVYILFYALFGNIDVPGYASLIVVVLFLGGLQLIGLGIIGQYLGRAYIEAKNRPIYIVRATSAEKDGSRRL